MTIFVTWCLIIKSDSGQHSQFLGCLYKGDRRPSSCSSSTNDSLKMGLHEKWQKSVRGASFFASFFFASLRVYSHIFGCCLGQLPTSQLCITAILTGFPKVVIWICFTISPIFVLYKWYYTNYRFHFVVIWICFTIVTSLYYTNVKTYWWIVGISFSKYISYVQFNLQRDKYEMTLSILI